MFSIKDTFNDAFKNLAENWKQYLAVTIIYALIIAVATTGQELSAKQLEDGVIIPFIVALSFQILISFIIGAWFMDRVLAIRKGEYKGLNPKDVLPKIIPFVALAILVQIVVMIGFVLLIIPGIYLGLRYSQSMFALLEGRGVLESMKYSAEITKGSKLKILGLYFIFAILSVALAFGGIVIGGFITYFMALLGLGSLATVVFSLLMLPITFISAAIIPTLYLKLKATTTA